MAQRLGLIIGNSEYEDPTLAQLKKSTADVNSLAEALKSSEIGGFDQVITLINQPSYVVRREIARFFAQKRRDDLLLLYFSGHGVKDDRGHLYLAVKDTEHNLLSATAVSAASISDEMDQSRSQRLVLILDCCHSGAFAQGSKGVTQDGVGTGEAFRGNGYGRVVLTATDSTQYAWEGDEVIGEAENSVYTHYLVQGLRTGEADANSDAEITLDELHDYVYEQVVRITPKQTPRKSSHNEQRDIVIARNLNVKPAELSSELRHAIENEFPLVRERAVNELTKLLQGSHRGLVLAAQQALEHMAEHDDSRRISTLARETLQAYQERQSQHQLPTNPRDRPKREEPKQELLRNLYETGMQAMETRDWKESINTFQQVLDLDPGYREAARHLYLAREQQRKAGPTGEDISRQSTTRAVNTSGEDRDTIVPKEIKKRNWVALRDGTWEGIKKELQRRRSLVKGWGISIIATLLTFGLPIGALVIVWVLRRAKPRYSWGQAIAVAITWIIAYITGFIVGAIALPDGSLSTPGILFLLIFAGISGPVISGIVFWWSILDVPRG